MPSVIRRIRRLLPGGHQRANSVVAVDIGPDAVRALRVEREGATPRICGFRVVEIDENHPFAVAWTTVLDQLRKRGDGLAVAVVSPGAAIRRLELPPMSSHELREALPWEARRHVAGLEEGSIVDAQILAEPVDAEPMRVLLAAFPRGAYDDLAAIWSATDPEPEFVDLASLATMNAVLRSEGGAPDGHLACLDIGVRNAFFAIFSSVDLVLHRDLSSWIDRFDRRLATAFHLAPDDVDGVKRSLGGEGPPLAEVREALDDVLSELAEDLRAARLYVENRTGHTLERVSFSGCTARCLEGWGLITRLEEQTGLALEAFDPLAAFVIDVPDAAALRKASPELAAAAGVAARYLATS